jgi:hypothetical protein
MSWYDDSLKVAEHNISAIKNARDKILDNGDPVKTDILYASDRGVSSRKITITTADEARDLLRVYERNLKSLKKRDYKPLQHKGKRKKHA